MLHSSISSDQTETNLAMPGLVPTLLVLENGDPPQVYVYSADTHHGTRIPIKVHLVDTGHSLAVDSLLDSGATGMFIDVEYVRTQKVQAHPLSHAIPVYNIDGTPNEAGSIKEGVDLICTFGDHSEHVTFLITSLGSMGIILGHTWLVKHNPEIDQQTDEVKISHCPGNRLVSAQSLKEVTPKPKKSLAQSLTQREWIYVLFVEDEGREHIDTTYTVSKQLAKRAMETGPTKSFEDLVPKEYWEFQDIFSKKSFDQLLA